MRRFPVPVSKLTCLISVAAKTWASTEPRQVALMERSVLGPDTFLSSTLHYRQYTEGCRIEAASKATQHQQAFHPG